MSTPQTAAEMSVIENNKLYLQTITVFWYAFELHCFVITTVTLRKPMLLFFNLINSMVYGTTWAL